MLEVLVRKALPFVVVAVLLGVIVWLASRPNSDEAAPDPVVDVGLASTIADAGVPDVGVAESWLVAEPRSGSFVAQVDGAPVEAQFTIGAAGVYPPLVTRGNGIGLPAPATTMRGEVLDTVEVYARDTEGTSAFWGTVAVDADGIDLEPAQPVAVRLLDASGTPIAGASLRLAPDVVGLVMLTAQTDDAGNATFDSLPPGEFVVTAEVRGARVESATVSAGEDAVLVAERGREVRGVVRTPQGDPVAGATVAVHGAGIGANPLDDVPADIVETDATGAFAVSGVPGAQFVAVVLAAGWAPTHSSVEAPEPDQIVELTITLRAGRNLSATVVDESGRRVPGAKVEWTDESTGLGGTALTDRLGQARFAGVPADATVLATFDRFESGRVSIEALGKSANAVVELRLTNVDNRRWRYRLHVPDGVVLQDLQARDGRGVRCSVSTTDGRDFLLESCGDGVATFTARTDRGEVEWDVGAFADGLDVKLPEPVDVRITVRGEANEDWNETGLDLAAKALVVSTTAEKVPKGRRIDTRIYPGRWVLTVTNTRIGMLPFVVHVAADPVDMTVELVALTTIQIRTVDSYGAPVTGAYVMLFSGGRLVDAARSAGQLPTEFRVRPPFEGAVLAVDARRGEGRVVVSTSADSLEHVAKLREPVLTLDGPPNGRPSRETLVGRLGGKLVERDQGVILDFDGVSAGTKAGLRRGDFLVTAWTEGTKMRVVVYRGRDGYVDVTVP